MTTAKEITTAAKAWVGTPFMHMGRTRGFGADCIGLVLGVLKEVNYPHQYEDTPYRPMPGKRFMDDLYKHCLIVWKGDATVENPLDFVQEADIAAIAWGLTPAHAAFLTWNTSIKAWYMIHAHSDPEKVVHHRVDEKWRHRIKAVFRLPNLVDGHLE